METEVDLSTSFASLKLRSPILAASAPPTEHIKAIEACVEAGVGAIVTKSIADYRREDFRHIPRRATRAPNGQWYIQGSFASETLTLAEGINLFREIGNQYDIPIIASVAVLDAPLMKTINTCYELASRGAAMIHLDLFYTPQPRASAAALSVLEELLHSLKQVCSIPIAIKINLDYPAHIVAKIATPELIDAVFLLDSIRVPPPASNKENCGIPNLTGACECSMFGPSQKPLTLQYTRILSSISSSPICAGGGFQNAEDALEAFSLGATAVQFATPIMVHGARWIAKTTRSLRDALSMQGYPSLTEYQHAIKIRRNSATLEAANPAKAIILRDECIRCGVCTRLMFCNSIKLEPDGYPTILRDCCGCGFCAPMCPTTPAAIRLVRYDSPEDFAPAANCSALLGD